MPGVRDTLRVFIENSPSPVDLWRSRRSTFERAHCILPSSAVVGESVRATVQARDGYERIMDDFDGEFELVTTDPDGSHPETVSFAPPSAPTTTTTSTTPTSTTPTSTTSTSTTPTSTTTTSTTTTATTTTGRDGGGGPDGGSADGPWADDAVLRDVGGVTRVGDIQFGTPGVQYLVLVHVGSGRRFVSNPIEVHAEEPEFRRYWGDIHLHSKYSDGSGSMRKGFAFGRDVMDLDVVAYTDHDTMGFFIPPRLQRRLMRWRNFEAMKRATEAFDDPGSFVTLFGYEWTKQPNRGGHLNVYFDDVERAELFDSISPESNTYEKLWARLREWRDRTGGNVLAFPHHTAEAMYPFDFSATEYDDELAPLVEVYSQWGSSELPGSEENHKPVAMGQGEIGEPGHYLQDALQMGYRVGMLASADYHGPHPGHSLIHADPHLPALRDILEDGFRWGYIWRIWNEQSYPGGLVAFYAPELTREAVFESLEDRRVYGTTQPDRIVVHFAVNGTRPGDVGDAVIDAPEAEREVTFRVAGTAPLEEVTVVKNNANWHVRSGDGTGDGEIDAGDDDEWAPNLGRPDGPDLETYVITGTATDDTPVEGMAWDDDRGTDADVYYLRVRQADGGMAWAGPVWVAVA